jgi:predicted transcriptional regulator
MTYSKNNRTRSGNNSIVRTTSTLSMTMRIYRFIKENPLNSISEITEATGYSHIASIYPHINVLVYLGVIESIENLRIKRYKVIEK